MSVLKFFSKNIDELPNVLLFKNPNINSRFVKKHFSIKNLPRNQLTSLSCNESIDSSIFEELLKDGDSDEKCFPHVSNKGIDSAFLFKYESHYKKEGGISIFQSPNIDLKTIEQNLARFDDIDWKAVCYNPNITEEFIEKFIENPETSSKIDWDGLYENKSINAEFIMKHQEMNHENVIGIICWKSKLSKRFIAICNIDINTIGVSLVADTIFDSIDIDIALVEKLISIKSDLSQISKKIWLYLSENKFITTNFAEKYLSYLDILKLCKNDSIPFDFVEKHFYNGDIDIISTCYNKPTLSFLNKHFDEIELVLRDEDTETEIKNQNDEDNESEMPSEIFWCDMNATFSYNLLTNFLERDHIIKIRHTIFDNPNITIDFIERNFPSDLLLSSTFKQISKNPFTYQKLLDKSYLSLSCIRCKLRSIRLPNRYNITKLIKTSEFNRFWYASGKMGNRIGKMRLLQIGK